MRAAVLWILPCLAAWAATALADGWALPFAAFALWVAALLVLVALGALLQRVSPRASLIWRRALMASDGVAAPVVDPGIAATVVMPTLRASGDAATQASSSIRSEATSMPDGQPGWYRHLADLGIGYSERWPREGICSSTTWLLRAGDTLLLRFVPPAGGADAHPCDFGGPGDAPCVPIRVPAHAETRLAIAETGLYRVGVGQGDWNSADDGAIAVWLQVPDADRLALSNDPQPLGSYRYLHRDDGALTVKIIDEGDSPHVARINSVDIDIDIDRVPRGAALLFDPATMAWDEASVRDPASDWRHAYHHVSRWYLQLRRGDVLAMEFAWRDDLLGERIEFGDSAGFTDGRLEVTGFVRTPTQFSCGTGSGITQFTCVQDGFHFVQLTMYGPPDWRGRPSQDFVAPRLWGLRLQRPSAVRDFALAPAWIEDWHQRVVPVPQGVLARTPGDAAVVGGTSGPA